MRNILILITLISGLIFTSLIKNKTRLLEKELIYLDNEINILSSDLSEASLDFYYLTTPNRISLLVKNFLNENFVHYKESQIQKSIKPQKDLIILKKLKNDNTPSQLSTEESVNKKSNVAKEIDNTQLLITESNDKKNSQKEKKKIALKKIQKWTGIQAIKVFFGIPNIPVK